MKVVILSLIFSMTVFAQDKICENQQKMTRPTVNLLEENGALNSVIEQELVQAIRNNDLDKIKQLLASGVDPNTIHKGINGDKEKPVIFIALEYQRLEAFKLLLAHGAKPQLEKSSELVFDNNFLMVAFRKHTRLEGKGNLSSFIKILLDQEFEYEGKQYQIEYDPYAKGGITGNRDVVSVIYFNKANAESLKMLYSHPKIDPKRFVHKRSYIAGAAIRGEVDFLNLYLDFNAQKVSPSQAKKALEYLSEKFNTEEHKTANFELIERLREIAYKK